MYNEKRAKINLQDKSLKKPKAKKEGEGAGLWVRAGSAGRREGPWVVRVYVGRPG